MIRKTKAQIDRMKLSLYCSKCRKHIFFIPKSYDNGQEVTRKCPVCNHKLKLKYSKEEQNG